MSSEVHTKHSYSHRRMVCLRTVLGRTISTDSPCDKSDAFRLKTQPLLECRFTREQDPPTRADNPMPGNIRRAIMKRPHHLPGGAFVAGSRCYFAIRHDFSARNSPHDIKKFVQLHFVPVTSFSFAKKLFFRSVSMPQFTGGDWYPSGSK